MQVWNLRSSGDDSRWSGVDEEGMTRWCLLGVTLGSERGSCGEDESEIMSSARDIFYKRWVLHYRREKSFSEEDEEVKGRI